MAARADDPDASRPEEQRLSSVLESALERHDHLTIGQLAALLDERSFALVLMILMFPSALPIPTGGVTHIFELAAVLVAAQMVVGKKEIWFPRRVRDHVMGTTFRDKGIPAVIKRVRWFERFARPRLRSVLETRAATTVLGVVIVLLVTGAFVAPPFSGLDTLPSLGVVVICVGLLFSDGAIVVGGIVIGSGGIALEIALARVTLSLF